MRVNKDVAITYLKEINKNKTNSDVITKLYYNDKDYVQDFSHFVSYMSDNLRNAIQNGQTLTSEQTKELDEYVIEGVI